MQSTNLKFHQPEITKLQNKLKLADKDGNRSSANESRMQLKVNIE